MIPEVESSLQKVNKIGAQHLKCILISNICTLIYVDFVKHALLHVRDLATVTQ